MKSAPAPIPHRGPAVAPDVAAANAAYVASLALPPLTRAQAVQISGMINAAAIDERTAAA